MYLKNGTIQSSIGEEDETRQELSKPLAYTTYTNWGHLARISYLIINKNETYVL